MTGPGPAGDRPTALTVGHLRYTVSWDKRDLDRLSAEMRQDLAGGSSWSRQIIAMDPDLAPDAEAETLLHEVLHSCLRAASIDPDVIARSDPEHTEERTVAPLASVLLQVMRANPHLVAYLQGRSQPAPVTGPVLTPAQQEVLRRQDAMRQPNVPRYGDGDPLAAVRGPLWQGSQQ